MVTNEIITKVVTEEEVITVIIEKVEIVMTIIIAVGVTAHIQRMWLIEQQKNLVSKTNNNNNRDRKKKQTWLISFANFNAKRALSAKFLLFRKELELIVDSGASCCLIDKKYIPKEICIDGSQTLEVSGVNGLTSTLGFVDTFLSYDSHEYPIRLHVMEQLPSQVVGLVGTNFLKKFEANIDFAKMKMELKSLKCEVLTIPART